MTKTRIGIAVLLLAALAVPGVWVLAVDDDDAPRQDDRRNVRVDRDNDRDDDRPRDGDRRRDSDRRRDTDRPRDRDRVRDDDRPLTDDAPTDAVHVQHLGRTVKLEFTIIGEESRRSLFSVQRTSISSATTLLGRTTTLLSNSLVKFIPPMIPTASSSPLRR